MIHLFLFSNQFKQIFNLDHLSIIWLKCLMIMINLKLAWLFSEKPISKYLAVLIKVVLIKRYSVFMTLIEAYSVKKILPSLYDIRSSSLHWISARHSWLNIVEHCWNRSKLFLTLLFLYDLILFKRIRGVYIVQLIHYHM